MTNTEISSNTAARLGWIEQAYTAVAVFCFTWAAAVVVAIYTKAEPKLPVIGSVVRTEYVVYTLYAFSVLLPLLLALLFWHRSAVTSAGLPRQFPAPHLKGLPVEGMPAPFRVAAFVVLVGLPVFAQELAYQRLYDQVEIVWKPTKWWRTGDYNAGGGKPSLKGEDLFSFPAKPEDTRSYANWRFSTLPPETKTRPGSEEDNDGRPELNKGREPVQISTAPGYVPWLFRITAYGSIATVVWLLLTARGTRAGQKPCQPQPTAETAPAPSAYEQHTTHVEGRSGARGRIPATIAGTQEEGLELLTSEVLTADCGSELRAQHIFDAIRAAAPFARSEAGKNYVGMPVKWRLVLAQFLPNSDGSVRLRFVTERRAVLSIFCDVTTGRWPVLRTIYEESIFDVTGTVAIANQFEIHLNNVELRLIRGTFKKHDV